MEMPSDPSFAAPVVFSFHGEQQGAQLGHSVDALADLNGNGVAEMLLGAGSALVLSYR